jgi:zinc/manganese transport system substrate-binding protein
MAASFRRLCTCRICNAEKEVIINMISKRFISAVLGLTVMIGLHVPALAADKITVVASFSILGDMTRQVGGDQVRVVTLVGPNGDTHAYEPSPADVRTLADARLLIFNGLGLEGWLPRLVEASGFSGMQLIASDGIVPLKSEEPDEDGHHHHGAFDPHAWQSLANGVIYVHNIADALARVDPNHAEAYRNRASAYTSRMSALHEKLKADFAAISDTRRKIVTSHDAFGYFGKAYGIDFVAPEGISTEAEASARDVARIIDQIRTEKLAAVFVENISDERLIRQIAKETSAKIGGQLYSDALSEADGPAPDYMSMFEYNASQLLGALTGS